MSTDRFTANLLCPECGNSGIAKMHELDGIAYLKGDKTTRLDHMPDGFKRVDQLSLIHI